MNVYSDYSDIRRELKSGDKNAWTVYRLGQQRRKTMKISARNILKGKIVEITKGATTAHVRIDVAGTVVTSSITNAAVDDLKLTVGNTAYAVVKASDVMIGVD